MAALLLAAAAQPLVTDDLWWHLALGRSYAAQGPWLAADPLLYTAPGPPAPAAWASDVLLAGVLGGAGFQGLRLFHAALVVAILALAWSLARRAGGSRAAASAATAAFVALAAYRLFQLRPHLLTLLATLALYRLVLEERAPPSRVRVLLAALLLGVWANAHGGFLLGPILLAAAAGGLLLAAPLREPEQRRRDRARAGRLLAALGLGLLATLANPSGVAQHLAYFEAGSGSPDLARVADEWLPLDPFAAPRANLPPSPLAWGLVWGLLVGTPAAAVWGALRWRRPGRAAPGEPDPALVAVAAVSLAGVLTAVRFSWLGLFPLLLLLGTGRAVRADRSAATLAAPDDGSAAADAGPRPRLGWLAALAALLLVPAFVGWGDWPMLSRNLPRSAAGYARPYPPPRYHAHSVWFLADSGLEGNLFNDYFTGGFLGFWLAPRLRGFVNGTLNVRPETLEAYGALRRHRGVAPGEGFLELLDREQVDVFMGIRLPREPTANRPWFYTTSHLEGAPGWIPVFREPTSAVYLRRNARNRENLARVAAYYAGQDVPFDAERGFEPDRVIREARGFAVAHGLVPVDFERVAAEARAGFPGQRQAARERLASLYAALGLYERAVSLDRSLLAAEPGALEPRRRLVWSLLRLGRAAEAAEEAAALAPATDDLSRAIVATARRVARDDDPEDARARVVLLPLFTPAQVARLMVGLVPPEARTRPP